MPRYNLIADGTCVEGFLKCNSNSTLEIYDPMATSSCSGASRELVFLNSIVISESPFTYPTQNIGNFNLTIFNSSILNDILFEMIVFVEGQQEPIWITVDVNSNFVPFQGVFNSISTLLMIGGCLLCVFNIFIKVNRFRIAQNNVNLVVLMFADVLILSKSILNILVNSFTLTFDSLKILSVFSSLLSSFTYPLTLVQIYIGKDSIAYGAANGSYHQFVGACRANLDSNGTI